MLKGYLLFRAQILTSRCAKSKIHHNNMSHHVEHHIMTQAVTTKHASQKNSTSFTPKTTWLTKMVTSHSHTFSTATSPHIVKLWHYALHPAQTPIYITSNTPLLPLDCINQSRSNSLVSLNTVVHIYHYGGTPLQYNCSPHVDSTQLI